MDLAIFDTILGLIGDAVVANLGDFGYLILLWLINIVLQLQFQF